MSKNDNWTKSPQTGRETVLQEFDEKNGVSKMDIGTGFYTNEYPLNYKKHPDFDIKKYEINMPTVLKEMMFDDGESYWYPTTLQTKDSILFPSNMLGEIKWCIAPMKVMANDTEYDKLKFESAVQMEKAEFYDTYLEAAKKVKGYSLGDI